MPSSGPPASAARTIRNFRTARTSPACSAIRSASWWCSARCSGSARSTRRRASSSASRWPIRRAARSRRCRSCRSGRATSSICARTASSAASTATRSARSGSTRSFLDAIDHADIAVVRGVADPFKKIAWFAWTPAVGVNKLLGYNWQLDRWTQAENDITELTASVSVGYTLNAMDAFGELDDIPDRRSTAASGWAARRPSWPSPPTTGWPSSPGRRAQRRSATADEQLIDGHARLRRPARPPGADRCAAFTVKVTTSDFPGGARTQGARAQSPSGVTGLVPCRRAGLLFGAELTIPAGTDWNHAIGIDYRRDTGRQEVRGKRRWRTGNEHGDWRSRRAADTRSHDARRGCAHQGLNAHLSGGVRWWR